MRSPLSATFSWERAKLLTIILSVREHRVAINLPRARLFSYALRLLPALEQKGILKLQPNFFHLCFYHLPLPYRHPIQAYSSDGDNGNRNLYIGRSGKSFILANESM